LATHVIQEPSSVLLVGMGVVAVEIKRFRGKISRHVAPLAV
jgi:hypothetical protein